MELQERIADSIQELREKKGLSRKQLGEKIGKSQYSIKNYELNETTLSLDVLEKIAAAFEIEMVELIKYKNEISTKTLLEENNADRAVKLLGQILTDESIDKNTRMKYYVKYLSRVEK